MARDGVRLGKGTPNLNGITLGNVTRSKESLDHFFRLHSAIIQENMYILRQNTDETDTW